MLNYYSIVGLRPIPVVTPLLTVWKREKSQDVHIKLIVTPQSKEVAEKVRAFLTKRIFTNSAVLYHIELIDFNEFLAHLRAGNLPEGSYLNLTPGMNWQIAKIVLFLPETLNITLLYQDFTKLYGIIPKEYPKVFSTEIDLEDIGLDNYTYLNDLYLFTKKEERKFSDVQVALGIKDTYEIKINSPDLFKKVVNMRELNIQEEKCNFQINKILSRVFENINRHLFFIRERGGFLYLYFVIKSDNQEQKKKFGELYRNILTFFPIQEYGIVIFENVFDMRTKIDGIYTTGDIKEFRKWLDYPPDPYKQKPEKVSSSTSLKPLPKTIQSVAIYCLGENIIPTLETLINWKNVDLHLIVYDKNSSRIEHFRKVIEEQFDNIFKKMSGRGRIFFIRTDHLGREAAELIDKFLKRNYPSQKPEIYLNITPGTKAQTIALSLFARYSDYPVKVYSYETKSRNFVELRETGNSIPLTKNISPQHLIPFYYVAHEVENSIRTVIRDNCKLFDYILNKLFSGDIEIEQNPPKIVKAKSRKEAMVIQLKDDYYTIQIIEKESDGKTTFINGRLPNYKMELIAKMWEILVYYQIKKLNIVPESEIFYSLKATDSKQHGFIHSEKDIVFIYKDYPVVIDCTISTRPSSLLMKLIHNRGDNARRFSRMSLSFLAVPIYDIDKVFPCEGIGIITLNELKSRESFLNFLDNHLKKLKTTT